MIDKADELANLWNKTKDPKYKDAWYKHIKRWADGHDNTNRRNVSSGSGNKRDTGIYKVI
jgi:hypothetical protein|tara:strand:- start:173 stop:352 length:180 start_codon:yes stop_codon:yes gene_type:complete